MALQALQALQAWHSEATGSFKYAIYAGEIESCERVFDILAKFKTLQKQSILWSNIILIIELLSQCLVLKVLKVLRNNRFLFFLSQNNKQVILACKAW